MLLLQRANELLAENKLKEAEFMFKAVLKEVPDNGPALFGLGRIAMRLEQYDHAIYFLKRACNHLPKMLDPLFALGDAFLAVGSAVDAKTVLEYTLSIAKHNAHAHYYLGQFYLNHGFISEAKNTFTAGLKCPTGPVSAFMLFELSKLDDRQNLVDHIKSLSELLNQYDNKRLEVVIHYALANCYHRSEDFKSAFLHYKLANEAQYTQCHFQTEDMLPFFGSIKSVCGSDFFNQSLDKVTATFTPVFIVGLPRTGSTLLEQMLIQHENIDSLGENTAISDKVVSYLEKRVEAPFPECLHRLSTHVLDYGREIYTNEIRNARIEAPYVINKLPSNFQSIGVIRKLFPDARFIHVTREFNANAWSVYSNYFEHDEPYFCSAREYQIYAQAEEELMTHFKQCIGRHIHTVSYETLLAEPEKTIKSTLNFLDQYYDPECMNYYKGKRLVHTLSKSQVRQPLTKAPIEAWKKYQKDFEGLLNQESVSP
ncbi:sulfotransferase (plasmid) [Pseudoalteromonas xiamenensis]|uniref:tetratricopeptide repeat-containing sulfotransferase family protein n=1 Tax=Pseudoalteromonas xiamenensis TaxID=882626 RepID=UPI0027E4B88D|nr:sulfotransferase [Pseudoalteromonas xiamenensis]WMN62242.1 sulfotransferase [Pseudoalteromonas xiamenensis]